MYLKRTNIIEYLKPIDFSTFLKTLLNENNIEFEQEHVGLFYLPSKNSTIVYKNINSSVNNKSWNEINVWEDLWNSKQNIVIAKIKAVLGLLPNLPARVCEVRRIEKQAACDFLENEHLQGYVQSKIKYGLFLPKKYQRLIDIVVPNEGLCVAVMTLSGQRRFRDGSISFEMIRFGGLKEYRIIGGFSKILKAFIAEKSPDHIMTYIDRDWSEGGNLEKFRFIKTEILPKIFFKINPDKLRIKTSNTESYDVYNAGSIKLEWKKE